MPANLTPEYLAAEAEYRAASEVRARIAALERMLAVIPKHKGTEHLRGSLRKKLSQLKDEAQQEKKAGHRVDVSYVPREGAGQVALLGPPNSGKSALLRALTNAEPDVAPYPFTTVKPLPGMMPFEDVQVQLVDTPPIGQVHYEGWISSLIRRADAVLLIIDPSDPQILDDLAAIRRNLSTSKIELVPIEGTESTPAGEDLPAGELADDELLDRLEPGLVEMPTLVVATKQDLAPRPEDTDALVELTRLKLPLVRVSAETSTGLDALRARVFGALGVIRVYTKPPGQEPSLKEPNVIASGASVRDLARTIHKELAEHLTFARIWGEGYHPGQRVGSDQVLKDGDIVELHD